MNRLAHSTRHLLVGSFVALAMAVGLASAGVGSAAAVDSSSRSVVGKSDAGKITSTVVGTTSNGDRVTGSFTPIKTVTRGETLYMKGFLHGVIQDAGPEHPFPGVELIPIKNINGQRLAGGRVAANASACDILNLVLGPLDLNLLGSRSIFSEWCWTSSRWPVPGTFSAIFSAPSRDCSTEDLSPGCSASCRPCSRRSWVC